MAVGEADALGGEAGEVERLHLRRAVAADVAVPQVVAQVKITLGFRGGGAVGADFVWAAVADGRGIAAAAASSRRSAGTIDERFRLFPVVEDKGRRDRPEE